MYQVCEGEARDVVLLSSLRFFLGRKAGLGKAEKSAAIRN